MLLKLALEALQPVLPMLSNPPLLSAVTLPVAQLVMWSSIAQEAPTPALKTSSRMPLISADLLPVLAILPSIALVPLLLALPTRL